MWGSPDRKTAEPEFRRCDRPFFGDSSFGPVVSATNRNIDESERPQRDLNPCYSLERAVSWAELDDGDVSENGATK